MKKSRKLTKLLSVFVLAGAMTASIGALSACGHKHTFSSDWAKDETGHWHEATCDDYDGEKNSFAAHTDSDGDGKCDVCAYEISVAPTDVAVTSVSLDQTEVTLKPEEKVTLTATVAPDNATDKTVEWSTSDAKIATVNGGVVTAVADGEAVITATAGGKSASCTVTVDSSTAISTVEQFLAFRNTAAPAGTYKLTADIDLTGVTLESPKAIIGEGVVFDGNGFTISNAVFQNAAAKEGVLCAQITGGTVTNVKFLNCVITSSNETAGIVTGLCEGGTISKIELNSCSATTTNNYVGMLFGRNTKAGTINISEITTKNGCTTSCAQYGGFLIGDMVSGTSVNFKNLHIDGEFKDSSGNGSFIAGRTRAGNVSVENAVISATMPAANSIGIFSGNGSCDSLVIKNVLIVKSNKADIYQSTKAPKEKTVEKLVALDGVTVNEATGTGENTVAYLKDTLGFDFTDVWTEEGTGYRLKTASANIKSDTATISSLKVNTANVKTRYKKGEEFSAEGISVMGVYSDGVQLVLNADTGYTVDSSAFNKDARGEYTITVKSKEDATKTLEYKVTVVEETGFVIYDEFMTHTYLLGGTLDKANLVVKSVWSDEVEEKVTNYTLSAVDMTTAGEKNVSVTYGSYTAQNIKISVQATKPVPVDGKIYVNVDAASELANGAQQNGVETFKTLVDAIRYLEACDLDASVVKVVRIKAGTYKAKITTSLSNLTLIGEDKDTTVLTYSAVESTVHVVSGSQYGLDCATLKVSGEGFAAYNLSIRNDFNYIENAAKESSPQGLALTVDGDRAVISNCKLYGNQDTLYLRNGRAYFKDTLIEGNVDFIFGEASGLAFFDNCEIRSISRYSDSTTNKSNNGYVTAMKATADDKPNYGYIFSGCAFTDDGKLADGSMSLGRPWGAAATVAFINCSFTKAYSTKAYDGSAKSRWADMSGNLPANADFAEFGSTGEGAITEAVNGGKVLTAEQAAAYTKANIFAATNGKKTWSAAWDCDAALTALTGLLTTTDTAGELYVSSQSVTVEAGATAELLVSRTPWNLTDKRLTVTVENSSVATYANGLVTGVAVGTTKITVTDGTHTEEIAVTVTESTTPASTTYSYEYGGENSAAWIEDKAQGTIKSSDDTPLTAIKLIPDVYLTLNATGTKATVTINGFTTGTSNALEYFKVEFLSADGTVLETLIGVTPTAKKNGTVTFADNVVETQTEFTSIRITSTTANKSVAVTSATIVVE